MIIYTLGYLGWKVDEVQREVRRLGALLVDVRLRPLSRNPAFTAKRLAERFGARYLWIKEWGNLGYRVPDAPIRLADWPKGLQRLTARLKEDGTEAVVLMCACREVAVCHRKTVAERLAEATGGAVRHLDLPPGRPREALLF